MTVLHKYVDSLKYDNDLMMTTAMAIITCYKNEATHLVYTDDERSDEQTLQQCQDRPKAD